MSDPLLRVRTLGAFEVRDRRGRMVIAADDPARHQLLKFLVGHPGLRAERRSIGVHLWENRGTRAVNLRFATHSLRRLLERYDAADAIVNDGKPSALALNAAAVEVDALLFEQRLGEAEAAVSNPHLWIAAIDAYHGTYLPDDDMPWLIGRRGILRLGVIRAVTRARQTARDRDAKVAVEDAIDRLIDTAADDPELMEAVVAREGSPAPASESEMIGREHHLERARSIIERALTGNATFVAIVGPPGVGTTTLARAMSADACARDAHVAWIDGSDGATFAQVRHAVRNLTSSAGSVARDLSDVYGPAIEHDTDIAPLAAAKLVLGLATRLPLAVVVDDAEYADEPTRAFIALLKTRLLRERLIVVLTADTGARSDAFLAPFFRDPLRSPELFEIDPLPANDARRLIPRFGREAVARCGGHPGYAAVFAAGSSALSAYEGRVRRWLGDDDASLVLSGLVNGGSTYDDLLLRFPEIPEGRLAEALERLERVGAVIRGDDGYEVVDPLVYELFTQREQ